MSEVDFGNYHLDPASYRLLRDGEPVGVEPLVLELLAYLIAHRDRVVSREELLEEVWKGRAVSEGTLAKAVHGARAALEETGETEGRIRTIRGRGYRFVGEVQERAETAPPPEGPQPSGQPGSTRRPVLVPLALLAAVAAAAATGWWWIARSALPPTGEVAVAVLPFVNATGDDELEWVELGLMDEIATALTLDHGLEVVPSEATLAALRAADLEVGGAPDGEQISSLRQSLGAARLLGAVVRRDQGLYRLETTLHGAVSATASRVASGSDLSSVAAHLTARVARELGADGTFTLHPVSDDPAVRRDFARGVHELLAENPAGARTLFESLLDREPDLPEARYRLAVALGELGEWSDSERRIRRVLEEAQSAGDRDLTARARRQLGRILHQGGDYPGALGAYRAALAHYRSVGDRRAEADVLSHIARVGLDLGDWELVQENLGRAREISREIGHEAGLAQIEFGLGVLAGRRGRLVEAEEHFGTELALRQRLGHRRAEARALHNLAANAQNRGRWSRSEELHQQALALRRELGDRSGTASSLVNLAVTNTWRGDLDAADRDAAEARAIFEELENPRGAAMADYVRSYVALGRRDWAEAAERTRDALALWREIGASRREPLALATLAEIADEAGNADEAVRLADEAHRRAEELGDRNLLAYSLRVRGRAARVGGDPDDAEKLLRSALEIAREVGNEGIEGSLATDLAELLLEESRPEEAAPFVELLAERFPESGEASLLEARLALARARWPAALEAAEEARERSRDLWDAEDQEVLDRSRRAVAEHG